MCVLCERARAQAFQVGDSDDGRVLKGLSIAPAGLIDAASAEATRQYTATDGVLDFYLHTPGGPVVIDGGGFGEQVIQSLPISIEDQAFFRAMVERLDAVLDLDFRESATAAGADVDLYYDTQIDLGGGGSGPTVGLATTSGFDGWELFINQPELADDENFRRYVLIHEFGHALGLEHPFEAGDGDTVNGSTDPWASAFPEETVMAYRLPQNDAWPEFFTDNDLQALVQIWGAEPLAPGVSADIALQTTASFEAGPDAVTGAVSGEVVQGGGANDQLFGGAGDDRLFGGGGDDLIRGGEGADWLNGGAGNDLLWGDAGADRFRLSAGFDAIRGFDVAAGDRLELSSDVSYRVAQGVQGVEISTAFGTTTLMGVSLASLDSSVINLV